MKDEVIKKLDEADLFLYSLEQYEDDIEELKDRAKSLENDCTSKRNKEAGAFEILELIFGFLFIGGAILYAIAIVALVIYSIYGGMDPSIVSAIICFMYVPGGIILALFGVLFLTFKRKVKSIDKRYDTHFKKIVNPQIEKIKEEMSQTYEELNQSIIEDREVLDFLPEKYRNRHAINYFIDVLKSGEADNLKEAYSLYNVYLYRMRMEESAEERSDAIVRAIRSLEREQEQTNRNLESLERLEYWKYLNERK